MNEKLEEIINKQLDKLSIDYSFKTDDSLQNQDDDIIIEVTFCFDLYDVIDDYIAYEIKNKKDFIQTADRIVFVLTINGEEKLPIIFNQELVSEIKNLK